jgi:rare lipoprotein A
MHPMLGLPLFARLTACAIAAALCTFPALAQETGEKHVQQRHEKHRKQVGKASYYAHRFAGRKMADGTRMDPRSDNAASKTLPLGSRARVTNLETGDSAEVTIRDRGPHVRGRIIDLSPATAREIGLSRKDGIARVEVVPIAPAVAPTDSAAVAQ